MHSAGTTGLEPATYCVTGSRSNQLSYAPAEFTITILKETISTPVRASSPPAGGSNQLSYAPVCHFFTIQKSVVTLSLPSTVSRYPES